jgi:hypothetical protein
VSMGIQAASQAPVKPFNVGVLQVWRDLGNK